MLNLNMTLAELVGCGFGMLGALLISLKSKWSGWGFVLYLVSNIGWIIYGFSIQSMGILIQQSYFTITSLVGVWFWLVKNKRQGAIA